MNENDDCQACGSRGQKQTHYRVHPVDRPLFKRGVVCEQKGPATDEWDNVTCPVCRRRCQRFPPSRRGAV